MMRWNFLITAFIGFTLFQAKKSKVEKPDKTVYCPMSRKPIRVKDLVDVQWTVARDPDDKRSLIARYKFA